jgi:hypothetical protein
LTDHVHFNTAPGPSTQLSGTGVKNNSPPGLRPSENNKTIMNKNVVLPAYYINNDVISNQLIYLFEHMY